MGSGSFERLNRAYALRGRARCPPRHERCSLSHGTATIGAGDETQHAKDCVRSAGGTAVGSRMQTRRQYQCTGQRHWHEQHTGCGKQRHWCQSVRECVPVLHVFSAVSPARIVAGHRESVREWRPRV